MSLLQMSFAGAIMIITIVVIRALAINKLPKKTFLVLWGIVLLRLLIPFSLPSMFSAYSLVGQSSTIMESVRNTPLASFIPTSQLQVEQITTTPSTAAHTTADIFIPVWTIIWGVGVLACALFFAISYIKCCREFQASLPVDDDFANRWLNNHPLHRNITIRQSSGIKAPLTYGLFQPVILMPKTTDWDNETSLEYVLAHEYTHIRRFDAATKLIIIIALCLHWFNPLVWVMYILINRDIELSCDEAVVRLFGENTKSSYAFTLISMEETKSGLTPLCNSFSKNAIEERITAIMKIKKTSLLAIFAAGILVIGVAAAFATTAIANQKKLEAIPNTPFTDEDYEKLNALKFNNYENMTISKFQSKVWELTDTVEYLDLLERFSQNGTVNQQKGSNETASFFFLVLEPLTAEKWESRDFIGFTEDSDISDRVVLEYSFTLSILDRDTLTVGEYNQVGLDIENDLQTILQNWTMEELKNEAYILPAIDSKVTQLEQLYNSKLLQVTIETVFTICNNEYADTSSQSEQSGREPRVYPNATVEDYQSLLALKTTDYQQMSVADFNEALLDWGNSDYDRTQRIQLDAAHGDYQVDLGKNEIAFVELTMTLSGEENHQMIQSIKTGNPAEDPWFGGKQVYTVSDDNYNPNWTSPAWCSLWYQFSYHLSDKYSLTVGERDSSIGGFVNTMNTFMNETSLESLLLLTEENVISYMQDVAAEYSNDKILITIDEKQVHYETMDERNLK